MPFEPRASGPVAAVDIGGTHVSSALVDSVGIRGERRESIDADADAGDLLDRIARCGREHIRRAGRVALAVPGPFDYLRGVGDFRGVAKFARLRGVDVRAGLAARWGWDPAKLRFINDAEAFGLGEWRSGAGARAGRCVAVTLGTGIGSAFVDRGRCVTEGAEVPDGGELHRTDVDGAPLEELVSRRALRRAYRERTGRSADVAEIADRARVGEPEAAESLVGGMQVLGRALAPWLSMFEADRLVVGGAMAASEDLLFPPLRRQLAASMGATEQVPDVVRGALPAEQASMIGAVLGTSSEVGSTNE
ncbi:ROK family protein [Nesterenkonia halophila]|uniref:ROK family protein n=1 Tax=Nesterenkonia halophila TaxID=302044 RepID=UPI001292177E|nr:ROK family protein [Nesterenkonia halophila]